MKNKKKRRVGKILLLITLVLFLCLVITVVGFGVYIKRNLESELPGNFFELCAKGESPTFFAYRFDDSRKYGRSWP